ncbi:putative quinol monooxygenase [Corynebacterium rouxii]|uniref:putative quinol monooxygenase n=1 Tax=Corynebacterium rouxii TaxID=2719119 RepID=UPI00313CCFE7
MIRMLTVIPNGDPEEVAGLAGELPQIREYVESAELYRSLAKDCHALCLLVKDENCLSDLLASIASLPLLKRSWENNPTDIYLRQCFELADGRWRTKEGREPATSEVIAWPNSSAVRIIIHGAYEDNPRMEELTIAEIHETRREPGCIQYSWMENIELSNHLMLIELWANQRIYDVHWAERLRTVEYRGDSGRSAIKPSRGESSREFYRAQSFDFRCGRFVPYDVAQMSESVVWGA